MQFWERGRLRGGVSGACSGVGGEGGGVTGAYQNEGLDKASLIAAARVSPTGL